MKLGKCRKLKILKSIVLVGATEEDSVEIFYSWCMAT